MSILRASKANRSYRVSDVRSILPGLGSTGGTPSPVLYLEEIIPLVHLLLVARRAHAIYEAYQAQSEKSSCPCLYQQ